jgi:hypothetical protein
MNGFSTSFDPRVIEPSRFFPLSIETKGGFWESKGVSHNL